MRSTHLDPPMWDGAIQLSAYVLLSCSIILMKDWPTYLVCLQALDWIAANSARSSRHVLSSIIGPSYTGFQPFFLNVLALVSESTQYYFQARYRYHLCGTQNNDSWCLSPTHLRSTKLERDVARASRLCGKIRRNSQLNLSNASSSTGQDYSTASKVNSSKLPKHLASYA